MFEGLSLVHLFFILVIAVVEFGIPILLIVLIVRYLQGRNRPDPRAILADRLARGEITREQFDTAMQALGLVGPANPPGPTTWGGPTNPPPGA